MRCAAVRLHKGMTRCLNALQHLHLPFVAPSLGGVESLVTLPAETSHLAIGLEGRKVCSLSYFPLEFSTDMHMLPQPAAQA